MCKVNARMNVGFKKGAIFLRGMFLYATGSLIRKIEISYIVLKCFSSDGHLGFMYEGDIRTQFPLP